jgi:hypothetical protein
MSSKPMAVTTSVAENPNQRQLRKERVYPYHWEQHAFS